MFKLVFYSTGRITELPCFSSARTKPRIFVSPSNSGCQPKSRYFSDSSQISRKIENVTTDQALQYGCFTDGNGFIWPQKVMTVKWDISDPECVNFIDWNLDQGNQGNFLTGSSLEGQTQVSKEGTQVSKEETQVSKRKLKSDSKKTLK